MIIIDSNNLAYIAYYSLGELSEGEVRTGTVFGFLNIVNRIAARFGSSMVFCFDSKKNKRKQLDVDYKANRHKDMTPEENIELRAMQKQITKLRKEVLPSMGFTNIQLVPGYEADDLIAHYVKRYEDKNRELVIVSTDQDLYQLLSTTCFIFNPRTKKVFTALDFKKKYGITPDKWAEVKAIAGDKSDNIKGVWKVGEKTAIKYINGQLNPQSKAYERIAVAKKDIVKYRQLVTLPLDGIDFGFGYHKQKISREKFIRTFDRLKFIYYLKEAQFEKWENNFDLLKPPPKKKRVLKRFV